MFLMFTGIILDTGRVASMEHNGEDVKLSLRVSALPLDAAQAGDSIAVNGVCLTITGLSGDCFTADVSAETLRCTNLNELQTGSRVNLETALTPTTALGGHLVSGHVDGVGRIERFDDEGRSVRYDISVPESLSRYIAQKGSITVDGVSLTVNTVNGNIFSVNIIPHTLEKTCFADYAEGSRVNIEVDIIARYLERLISAGKA